MGVNYHSSVLGQLRRRGSYFSSPFLRQIAQTVPRLEKHLVVELAHGSLEAPKKEADSLPTGQTQTHRNADENEGPPSCIYVGDDVASR